MNIREVLLYPASFNEKFETSGPDRQILGKRPACLAADAQPDPPHRGRKIPDDRGAVPGSAPHSQRQHFGQRPGRGQPDQPLSGQ